MKTAATLFEPVLADLPKVYEKLRQLNDVGEEWMNAMLSHVLTHTGKGLRPALTLLAGNFYDYNLDYLIPMATAVEVLHTATLVHDDTVDHAVVRRGNPTVNSLWNGNTAVLLGDYLFANSAELVSTTGNVRVMRLFAQTLMAMACGELGQVFSAYKWQQSRQDYYDRIARKTAALFSMAMESGAVLSSAPEEMVQALKSYGYHLGIGFQIVDDILDFTGDAEELGKPVGSDLLQGTMTLPALLLVERYPDQNPIKQLFEHPQDNGYLTQIIEMARNAAVIDEAYQIANEFCFQARMSLEPLPVVPAKQALIDVTTYIIKRRH